MCDAGPYERLLADGDSCHQTTWNSGSLVTLYSSQVRVPGPRLSEWKVLSLALYQLVDTALKDEDTEEKET